MFMIWELNNRILEALSLIASTKNNKLTKFRFMGFFLKKGFSRVCVGFDKKPTAHGYFGVELDSSFLFLCSVSWCLNRV